ncbi:hypothetical protein N7528_000047 [Penicillium herquei]|nr:hypothetical protein N7528_000047 [Penicillium herquei]
MSSEPSIDSGKIILESQRFFQIGNTRYFYFLVLESDKIPFLATVIRLDPSETLDSKWLENHFKTWLEVDDVFQLPFLFGAIFVNTDIGYPELVDCIDGLPIELQPHWIRTCEDLPPGPRMFYDGILYTVSRVYDDVNGAFVAATIPQTSPSLGVAVRSRMPEFYEKDKSLAGGILRPIQASKENMPSNTAEEPTESLDYHASFNPRADGYQSAWSSSGGSVAAIAAYEWLDFTLGTDTTGSSRRPAMANGAFQIRLTHDVIPLTNVVPSFPRFDSPAMYTRSIDSLEKSVGVWLNQEITTYADNRLPTTIIYLTDFLPVQNDAQMDLINGFISDVETALGVEAEKISLAGTWQASPSQGVTDVSIHDYLKDVGVNTFVYDVYHTMNDFRDKYHKKFGRDPYVNPTTRFRWNLTKDISTETHEDGMRRLEVYKEWLLEHILQTQKRNALVILPITSQEADYRETPPPPPTAPNAFDGIWLAPVTGSPEISVPIGELKYQSRISGNQEHLPVVVSVLGKPGSDMALIDAMKKALKHSGRPTEVHTGRRMFQ